MSNTSSRKNDWSALKASAGEAASMLRAIGNERRLMVLCLLIEHGELTAGEISEAIDLSPSATSQHLAKMRDEDLVAFRRDAQTVHYRIGDPNVKRVIALLKSIYCP
jgi:DNA-binding transcriptional ArsR family regulator